MEEVWKDIEGYEGLYQVSNLGRVKSLEKTWITGNGGIRTKKDTLLQQSKTKKGYLRVYLFNNGKRKCFNVHQLVALVFISNPDNKPQVDHINGIKTDNRAENLRWATNKENCNNPITVIKNSHPHTEEWKQNQSEMKKGKAPSRKAIEAAKELHKKGVNCYKNGCLIKHYDSLTEASIDIGKTRSAITNSINRNGTCNKCTWQFV